MAFGDLELLRIDFEDMTMNEFYIRYVGFQKKIERQYDVMRRIISGLNGMKFRDIIELPSIDPEPIDWEDEDSQKLIHEMLTNWNYRNV
jgi:hypothetical protein